MKTATSTFVFIPVATILNQEEIDGIIGDLLSAIEGQGGRGAHADAISTSEPLFLLAVTGGTEQKILELREKRKTFVPNEPVFILAHPGNNSLPAALEVLARLQQDGERGQILYLSGPKDKAGLRRIAAVADDLRAFHALRQARIGLVGAPSDWLVASSPDPEIVSRTWGPEVVSIRLDQVKKAIDEVPAEEIGPILDALRSAATELREPSEAEISDAVRVYLALKQQVDRHKLQAVAVRCFDLVLDLATTGCFALAQLNDDGVVAGCEGDLHATVAMLWVRELLDQTSWMANPARIDAENNALWLAHCTVPRELVEKYQLRSHFESGLGVGIQGTFGAGPVTLLRIGGRSMEKLWLAEGEILRTGDAENLCRTQIEVALTHNSDAGELLGAPLGNHLVLVPGHHAGRLRRWWRMMISDE